MKTKLFYLLLMITLILSSCSLGQNTQRPVPLANPASTAVPPAQAAPNQGNNPNPDANQSNNPDQKPNTNSDQNGGQNQDSNGGNPLPPKEAFDACVNKAAQDTCEFTAQRGLETGTCQTVQEQLACTPQRGPNAGNNQNPPANDQGGQTGTDSSTDTNAANQTGDNKAGSSQDGKTVKDQKDPQANNPTDANGSAYNIEQAVSDKAQGMTIAYDALAFLTGDLGSDSFFPPGKVADFWGFQYLRDNDPSQMGHAGDFLTSAAMNMLNTLTTDQRSQLVTLAKGQVEAINTYGYKRFVLMDAFRRLIQGDLPAGTTGLNEEAVKAYSAELYALDGSISFARAQMMGKLIQAFDSKQRAALDAMVGKGMLEWPKAAEPEDIRGLDRDVKVAVMTYAADMFSWYAGSVAADVYFCPERHGTYFGSFYLKDIPAMSDSSYAIPTNLTGDMGENMLKILTADQAKLITGLVDIQKPSLQGIVETREQISIELRKFKDGSTADNATVLALMKKYGQLDGEIIYNLAVNFTKTSQSLSADQKAQLLALRKEMLGDLMYPKGAYLYSQAIPMPTIPNTDFLFK